MAGVKKDKNVRLRPIWYVIIPVLVISLAALIITTVIKLLPQKENLSKANVSIIGMETDIKNIEETRIYEETTVKINLASCRVLVGTRFGVKASVRPEGTESSLMWKSSDPKVFTVNSNGDVEITGVGTAALTATVGDITDAIIIEGVNDWNARSQLGLPTYGEVTGEGGGQNNTVGISETVPAESESEETSDSQANQTTAETIAPSQPATIPVLPTLATAASTAAVQSRGMRSYNIGGVLSGYGFEQTEGGVYTYGEGDSYEGQIITQSDVTIIYIKKTSSDFYSAIQNVLEELLPDDYEQVWNNYNSASTDRTLTVEGRMVRIVTAGGNGHSQIVVYN